MVGVMAVCVCSETGLCVFVSQVVKVWLFIII